MNFREKIDEHPFFWLISAIRETRLSGWHAWKT
jgi:hypothetical protein